MDAQLGESWRWSTTGQRERQRDGDQIEESTEQSIVEVAKWCIVSYRARSLWVVVVTPSVLVRAR